MNTRGRRRREDADGETEWQSLGYEVEGHGGPSKRSARRLRRAVKERNPRAGSASLKSPASICQLHDSPTTTCPTPTLKNPLPSNSSNSSSEDAWLSAPLLSAATISSGQDLPCILKLSLLLRTRPVTPPPPILIVLSFVISSRGLALPSRPHPGH